jgi:thiosulfate/3-mercaptopyruvate sulfurtransferase
MRSEESEEFKGSTLPSPLVETAWLDGHLSEPDLRILDCSVVMKATGDGNYVFVGGRDEYERGHIPGSVFVDVLTELAAKNDPRPAMMPPVEDFANTMAAFGVGEGTRVVLYDRSHHSWAARVWWMLRVCGFDAAAVLNGGWQKWISEGRRTSTVHATYPRGNFRLRPRPGLMATKQEVLDSLHAKGLRLVNALSPEEHRGETARFPRAGRIPGSACVYYQSLVDPQTHAYLPPEQLRERFEAVSAMSADKVITYCGAGIAASSDALALTLLGKKNVAVYDGSLMEWTADPALPMEKD